jgi:multiple sugar transport system substrate-binding protein
MRRNAHDRKHPRKPAPRRAAGVTRRALVKSAAAALAVSALPVACGEKTRTGGAPRRKTLRILQWSHFVPAYDEWFDRRYTREWGERNGIDVVVDHMSSNEVNARGAAEASAGRGHDLFLFLSPPAAYEEQVIDHREIAEAVEKKHGRAVDLAERSTRNAATGKHFAFCDSYVPDPGNYRIDLWGAAGFPEGPATWEDLRVGGAKIRATAGNPVGIGLSQELDSNMALRALLWSFGGAEQDEEGRVVLNSKSTVEALKFARALYREAMTPEVFTWDPSSNNRMMLAGRGSFVQNAISVTRTAEKDSPDLARKIGLRPALAGPVRRIAAEHLINCYVIWKFAENVEGAKAFLVDLVDSSPSVFRESEFYNMPAYPSTVPDLAEQLERDAKAEPTGKYRVLAGALEWSTNVGYPGRATAAIDEVFNTFVIPTMFGHVARGDAEPEAAAAAADREVRRIFDRWKRPA